MLHYQHFMISSIKGIGSVLLIRFWFQNMPFLIDLFSSFLTTNSKKSKNNVIYYSIKLSSSVGSAAFFWLFFSMDAVCITDIYEEVKAELFIYS